MKTRSLLAALCLLFLALSLHGQTNEITIGVNLSTSGPLASVGIPFKNATLLGPSEIAGHKIRYVFLDDASDPTAAVRNVKRLISEENIDVLLGPTGTPLSLAVINTVAEAKVPMISLGSGSMIVAPMDAKRRWVFKPFPNDDDMAGALVGHMAKHGVKTLSLIAVDDAFGESWIQATTKIAARKNIKILDTERFQRTETSTTAQCLRAMKGNPDAILIAAVGTPAVTPHRNLVERGFKGKIYQSGGAVNPEFLRLGGKDVEGSYTVQTPFIVAEQLPDGYPTKQPALDFLKLYEAKYGARAAYAVSPWDSLTLLKVAIPAALKTGAQPGTPQFHEALRTALENCKGVVGALAVFNLSPTDHAGVNQLGVTVIRIENGAWKLEEVAAFKK